jgi:hypothetical protein
MISEGSFFGEASPKQPTDYINAAVDEAARVIRTSVIAANPRDPANGILAWRLRPSEARAIAIHEFQEPPPEWGLKVNLANMYIGPGHTSTIAHALILNHTVTTVDLSCCDMGTDAAIELMHCLERNRTLKHLNISGNLIGPEGGVKAASSLLNKLETLHIACNELGDVGGAAIAEALRYSTTLKFLNLRGNHMRLYTLYRLMEALDPTLHSRLSDDVKSELATSRSLIREEEAKAKARLALAAKEAQLLVSSASGASSPLTINSALVGDRNNAFEQGSVTPAGTLARRGSVSSFLASSQTDSQDGPSSSKKGNRQKNAMTLDRTTEGPDVGASHRAAKSPHPPTDDATPKKDFRTSVAMSIYGKSPNANRGASTADAVLPPSLPLATLDLAASPIAAPSASSPSCTTCNALWVHGNLDAVPKELLDLLNQILTLRVPQPPEGLNSKKKKGGRKGK